MDNDTVIWTKFSDRLAKKRGMSRYKLTPPVSKDGQTFDSYYTTEVSETQTVLYGVKGDGKSELIGIDETPKANLLAKMLNAGGFFHVDDARKAIQEQ